MNSKELRTAVLDILWLVNGWNKEDAEEWMSPEIAVDQITQLFEKYYKEQQ